MVNGSEASLECLDLPGVYYTLHEMTESFVCSGGKNG